MDKDRNNKLSFEEYVPEYYWLSTTTGIECMENFARAIKNGGYWLNRFYILFG